MRRTPRPSLLLLLALHALLAPLPAGATPPGADEGARSPFGAIPAAVIPPTGFGLGHPYVWALDLGMRWDRSLRFIWTRMQPDPTDDRILWEGERLLADTPPGIRHVANLFIGSPDPALAGADAPAYARYARDGTFLPRDEAAWTRFVGAVVERYDGDGRDDMPGLASPIRHWQVDNEPPHGLEGYARFLALTSRAVKGADPGAKVLIGGAPGMPPVGAYLEGFDRHYLPILREVAAAGECPFDILDLHWYGDAAGDYLGAAGILAHARGRLKALGLPAVEVWMTETGTYSGDPVPTPAIGTPRDYPPQTERDQAADLVRRYVHGIASGYRKIFTTGVVEGLMLDGGYFDCVGLVGDGRFAGDPGRGVKKLAYFSFKKMTARLEGSDWERVERVAGLDGLHLYRFIRGGRPIWVGWHDGADVRLATLEGVPGPSLRSEAAVPSEATGRACGAGPGSFDVKYYSAAGGRVRVPLTREPVYLLPD